MTLDDASVTQALFHPRPETHGYSPAGIPTTTRVAGAEIAGYLHENSKSDALLLFFHGNGEISADYDSIISIYTDCGVSCWIIDYRGYGRSTGTPRFSWMLEDAEAVLSDVARLGKIVGHEYKQVIVMGRSLGSASAVHLASLNQPLLSGIILDSPYANGLALIERLGGPRISRGDIPEFVDNSDKIRRCHLPILIIHGADDRIIPIGDAEALFKLCPGKVKHFLRVEGAGHNNLLFKGIREYRRELQNHIVRTTGGTVRR